MYSFSEKGSMLADKICGLSFDVFRCEKLILEKADNTEITKEIFNSKSGHIFIGAAGIAVRKIAPFVCSKTSDPAVLVIDEKGENIIPILSGHIGGANSLATTIAKKMNAKAVITTATDVNGLTAIDQLASEGRLKICDKKSIQIANSKLLNGETVKVYVDDDIDVACDDSSLYKLSDKLTADVIVESPLKYVIGVGCKKATDSEVFNAFLDRTLNELNINHYEIDRIASIDLKASEDAILKYCDRNRIMFETYSKDELNSVDGDFDESSFVKEITGVSNVSERAAAFGASLSGTGDFILKRKAENGMTVSVIKVKKRINLNGHS